MKRTRAFALIAMGITPIVTAGAQQPPPAQQHPPTADKPSAVQPAARPPTAKGPAIDGIWSGTLTQIAGGTATRGSGELKYAVVLMITAKGAESNYPGLECQGKLRRIGTSPSYAFFVEVITRGQADKGGRCPDGTITLTRAGENLGLEWFGIFKDELILASGTLTRKPAQ
jgi:hypothetical protein